MIQYYRCLTVGLAFLFSIAACKKNDVVQEEQPTPKMLSFSFSSAKNATLVYNLSGEIQEDSIFVRTFAGTPVNQMVPEFQHDGLQIEVGGVAQASGSSVVDFSKPVNYEVISGNRKHTYTVVFKDTGIPAVYISTNGKPIPNKEDYVAGSYSIYSGVPGTILHKGALEIKGRGNSTWSMPKKPYRLKMEEKTAVLGMPADKSWALMANYADRSLMRNEVGFEVSRRAGLAYTPRQQYADFFLNGTYEGCYNITEHLKEGADRIRIDENSGGFILEVDGYATGEPVHFITNQGVPVTVKFPDEEEITGQQKEYITEYYRSFEKALFSVDFKDPEKGYRKYLDMESFVNYYLANEISGNPDMLWSMRMYKKNSSDPKLYTGPVWDFDLAVNNDKRLEDASQKLMLEYAHFIRQWIDRIRQDPYFKTLVKNRWNAIKGKMMSIPEYADATAQLLRYSAQPNFVRWNILTEPNLHLSWYTGASYDDYVTFLKNYYKNRLIWLDSVFNGNEFMNN